MTKSFFFLFVFIRTQEYKTSFDKTVRIYYIDIEFNRRNERAE